MSSTQYHSEFNQTNIDNCANCRAGTCTEVYHKQIRDHGHEEKGFFEKVKDKVDDLTGKSKDPVHQTRKEIGRAEDRAEKLTKEGRKELHSVEKDVKKAEKAQCEAAKKAAEANRKTEHALNKQLEGQEKLATAGKVVLLGVGGYNGMHPPYPGPGPTFGSLGSFRVTYWGGGSTSGATTY